MGHPHPAPMTAGAQAEAQAGKVFKICSAGLWFSGRWPVSRAICTLQNGRSSPRKWHLYSRHFAEEDTQRSQVKPRCFSTTFAPNEGPCGIIPRKRSAARASDKSQGSALPAKPWDTGGERPGEWTKSPGRREDAGDPGKVNGTFCARERGGEPPLGRSKAALPG